MEKISSASQPFDVAEVTKCIGDLFARELNGIWITGELTELKPHTNGHVYLTLSSGPARLAAVIWKGQRSKMPMPPVIGSKVIVHGKITVYPPRGSYQLDIDSMILAGQGVQQAALEELKRKLAAEGLFDPARKRKLPYLPRAVGLVTSQTGAAVHDFMEVFWQRAPQIPIIACYASVQGTQAPPEIADAIATLGKDPRIDWIVVTRGGGSNEDLSCFNDERVVRAIAASPLPVISAVGHEVDVTLADFAADLRAPTPTAAAQCIPIQSDLLQMLADYRTRLDQATARWVERNRAGYQNLELRLQQSVRLDRLKSDWNKLQERLQQQNPSMRWAEERRRFEVLRARFSSFGPAYLLEKRNKFKKLEDLLSPAIVREVTRDRAQLGALCARLESLSPLASLKRGYAIATHAGSVVTSVDALSKGDSIEIRVSDGLVEAQVLKTKRDSHE